MARPALFAAFAAAAFAPAAQASIANGGGRGTVDGTTLPTEHVLVGQIFIR